MANIKLGNLLKSYELT